MQVSELVELALVKSRESCSYVVYEALHRDERGHISQCKHKDT